MDAVTLIMLQEHHIDLLTLENVNHEYPGGETLYFPSVRVAKGQHTLLLGDSGTGKSTMLHILTGLLKPTVGRVVIDGQDLYMLSARKLDKYRGRNIGIVFQNAHLIDTLDLYGNMRIAQEFAGARHDPDRIHEVLGRLGLDEHAHKYPRKLSRGQLQRAAIARAVVNSPSLLVADEPTASLDDRNTNRVMELLFQQAEQHGATLILATHDNRIKDRFAYTYILDEYK